MLSGFLGALRGSKTCPQDTDSMLRGWPAACHPAMHLQAPIRIPELPLSEPHGHGHCIGPTRARDEGESVKHRDPHGAAAVGRHQFLLMACIERLWDKVQHGSMCPMACVLGTPPPCLSPQCRGHERGQGPSSAPSSPCGWGTSASSMGNQHIGAIPVFPYAPT